MFSNIFLKNNTNFKLYNILQRYVNRNPQVEILITSPFKIFHEQKSKHLTLTTLSHSQCYIGITLAKAYLSVIKPWSKNLSPTSMTLVTCNGRILDTFVRDFRK